MDEVVKKEGVEPWDEAKYLVDSQSNILLDGIEENSPQKQVSLAELAGPPQGGLMSLLTDEEREQLNRRDRQKSVKRQKKKTPKRTYRWNERKNKGRSVTEFKQSALNYGYPQTKTKEEVVIQHRSISQKSPYLLEYIKVHQQKKIKEM